MVMTLAAEGEGRSRNGGKGGLGMDVVWRWSVAVGKVE